MNNNLIFNGEGISTRSRIHLYYVIENDFGEQVNRLQERVPITQLLKLALNSLALNYMTNKHYIEEIFKDSGKLA